VAATCGAPTTRAAELVTRDTDQGVIVGYKDTPLLPWTNDKYCVHDPDRPVPELVDAIPPGESSKVPSDAIVLFDGQDVSHFEPTSWKVRDGYLEAGEGSLVTKEPFGDIQLHVEWAAPAEASGHFMSRGNSGVLLMGTYEIQIFDSWRGHDRQIYPDGQAASVYGQTPPLVNACLPPGQWQSFDIVFRAPVFADGAATVRPAVTMFHNGVLVHRDQEIMGPMAHRQILPLQPHLAKLPLVLQGHGSPVRFRNIWVRVLE